MLAAKDERERAQEAYGAAGAMFDQMGVALGQERVRSALAALDSRRRMRSG